MPSADSRRTVKMDRSLFSHDSVTCGGSPEVSSTAFRAPPPDLPPVRLVEPGFAVICQLAQHRRPHHPVLVHRLAPLLHASFRPRLATTPLRFASPSPPPDWAGDFHPPKLSNMFGTHRKGAAVGPRLNFFYSMSIEYQVGGGVPPTLGHLFSEWNQWNRGKMAIWGLDKIWDYRDLRSS
jgi:hypothetical protein